jgi:DNA-binding NtrC family response regulator
MTAQLSALRRDPAARVDATPSGRAKVLIVDDVEDARWALCNLIRLAGGVSRPAASGAEALASLREDTPDLVLLDVCLPDMDGFEILNQVKAHDKTVLVIMLTAYGKTHDAVRAIRAGAYDYVAKPFNHEELLLTVRRALEDKALRGHLRQARDELRHARSLIDLMGRSSAVQRIVADVEQVGPTNLSVLVTGDTGTGKELVAQAVHAESLRAGKPFVVVDCGAIPEALLESELFGHEKGAFTGAHHAKAGAFELAASGTIFLDEIGNLPLAMQGTLLRVLETRRVRRIGTMREQEVDFRVLAASNANLRATVDQQAFRADLYHRLAGFTIHLPPLRERKEDLAFLVERFVAEANRELSRQVGGVSEAAWGIIRRYEWPGNVRELRNQVRRAVLLCDDPGQMITPECLGILDERSTPVEEPAADRSQHGCTRGGGPRDCPFQLPPAPWVPGRGRSLKELMRSATAELECAILLEALEQSEGNKAQAARLLKIDYKTMQTKLKAYAIFSTRVSVSCQPLPNVHR